MRPIHAILITSLFSAAASPVFAALCSVDPTPPCDPPPPQTDSTGGPIGGHTVEQEWGADGVLITPSAKSAGKDKKTGHNTGSTGEPNQIPATGVSLVGDAAKSGVAGTGGGSAECDRKCKETNSNAFEAINTRLEQIGNITDQNRWAQELRGLKTEYFNNPDLQNREFMVTFTRLITKQLEGQGSRGSAGGAVTPDAGTGENPAKTPLSPHSPRDEVLGEVLDRGRVMFPKDPAFFSYTGQRELRNGNAEGALENFQKAVQLGAKDKETFLGYGSAAHQLGDMETASKMSQKVIAMDPNNQKALSLYNLSAGRESRAGASSAFQAGMAAGQGMSPGAASGMTPAQIAAAASQQTAAPRSGVEKSAAYTREAASALGVRDYSEAFVKASQAIAQNPQNAQAWNYRATADNKLKRYNDAVYDSSFALGLVPGNSPALANRSWAFSQQQKYKEGLADASAILEREPDNAFAYQNRALAFAGLGDRAQMIESLKRSAELDPRFQDRYQKALQAPQNADVMYLFDDGPAGKGASVAVGAPAIPKKKRFMMLSLTSVAGGLLVAMGFLHIFSAAWREKVRTTMKRVIGGASVGQASEGGDSAASGLWGQYELLRELGTGGMGVVYEAKDKSLERTVAIKKMRDEIRVDPRERSRFMTEAKTVAGLHHPNIVDIYSIIEEAGDVYLVFEYVDGKNLSEVLRETGPMPFDAARRVIKSACEAVEYAHKHKVIHRDLKPSNIMVSTTGEAKVMDFGVARQAQDAMSKALMTNTVVGTPPYMAPEQEQGTVRPESDVYALGIVFYEMLSGQLPFAGHGAGMLLNKINGRFAPLSQSVASGLPPGMDEFMTKALNPDPDKRYRTPADLLAAVEALGLAKAA